MSGEEEKGASKKTTVFLKLPHFDTLIVFEEVSLGGKLQQNGHNGRVSAAQWILEGPLARFAARLDPGIWH